MAEATVMIAAWNAASTIARSVASAREQSGVLVETIVVDDASCDDTLSRAEAAGARVLAMAENGGPSVARNRAIEAAEGDWIAVLDSDDAMAPERLRRMIDLGTRMQADVVLGNFWRVDGDGNPIDSDPFLHSSDLSEPQTWTLKEFLIGNLGEPGSPSLGYLKPIFRRSFLCETGLRYDTRLRNSEDCHLIFACLAAGAKVVFSPDPGYLYTVRRGSISYRVDPTHIEALIEADAEFLAKHAEALSPDVRALFDLRCRALRGLQVSEEVLRALKARRPGVALGTLARQPAAIGRVLRQLLEAAQKRVGRRRIA